MRFPKPAARMACRRWPALSLVLLIGIAPACALEIARGGTALVPIASDGAPGIEEAVADLRLFLGRMTGAQFELRTPEECAAGPAIFVGPSYFPPAEAALRDRWLTEQIADVRTREGSLYISGGGPSGCTFAVYAFLEDVCGVRFYHPGELGTQVPDRPDLSLDDVSLRQTPSFLYRRMWPSAQTPDRRMYREWQTWFRRSRQGGPAVVVGHNLFRIVPPELYDQHPDYFPLLGGVRLDPRSGAPWQPELAHPGVIQLAVDKARAAFDANPDQYSFSLSMNDSEGWSESPEALAQDPPQFRGSQQRGKARRMLVFANAVAEQVAQTHPDRYLAFYAYKSTLEPPTEPMAHANVIPALCHWGIGGDPFHPITATAEISPNNVLYRRAIDGWDRLAEKLIAREYWTAPRADPLLKSGVTPILFEDIPYYFARGFIGCNSEANIDWGALALNHYVAARLMWDVKLDPAALLDDYFAGYYGAAAAPMRRYFTRVWEVAYKAYLPEARAVPISDEDIAFLDQRLGTAEAAVAGDELRAARVRMARDFFDAWRDRRALLATQPTGAQIDAYLARLDALAEARSDALVAAGWKAEFMAPLVEPTPYDGPELARVLPEAPLDAENAQPLIARRSGRWLVLVGEDRRIVAEAIGVRVGPQYTNRPSWQITSAAGEAIASGHTPLPGSTEIDVAVPEPGLYRLDMNAGANGCGLIVRNCPAVLIGPGYQLCEWPGRMYFWVPEATEQFTVTLFASRGESALMRIHDPAGEVVFERDSLTGDVVPAQIAPTPQQRGAAWCVEIAEAPEGMLEDYQLLLGDTLPPYLATSPGALLAPAP